jgi:hypothetical protein
MGLTTFSIFKGTIIDLLHLEVINMFDAHCYDLAFLSFRRCGLISLSLDPFLMLILAVPTFAALLIAALHLVSPSFAPPLLRA